MTYLAELEKLTPEFATRGVKTFALSVDGEERARLTAEKDQSADLAHWLRSEPQDRAMLRALYLDVTRKNLDRYRRAAFVLGAGALYDRTTADSLLWLGASHALRVSAFFRALDGPRRRNRQTVSGMWRVHRACPALARLQL